MSDKSRRIIKRILLLGSVFAAIKLIFVDYTLDEEYQKKKAAAGKDTQQKTGRHSGQQKAGAQFHSFEQRTYDYDALQKTLSAVSDGNRHSE